MVIKILGGKKASIRYQLKNPTARILHGDPAVTQRLIDASHFSQKYCGIVLSFEEIITAETESAKRRGKALRAVWQSFEDWFAQTTDNFKLRDDLKRLAPKGTKGPLLGAKGPCIWFL
jgi:hypothetical protein